LIAGLSQSPIKALTPTTADGEPLSDALAFMQLLWAVAHGLESSSKRMHAELGVTGPQRLVLRIVGHYRRIAAGQLAEVLHIHPSSLTGMLRRLEEADLLRRESDPFDRRRALLALSKRGQRLNDQREGTIEAVVAAALTKMSKERVASAKTVLKAIAAALAADNEAGRR
jgi:DNA-binding MarR family transcriptional regulator